MCDNKNSLLNRLYIEASKSKINQQLAAAIIKSGKLVSRLCCNSPRNTYHGYCCGSLHAEAHVIISYYGKSLSFDRKHGWCFLSSKKQKGSKS
jgi:hypothetical protein